MKIFKIIKDTKENIKNKCVICGEEYEGYGNNPYPVKDYGKCCDKCNLEKVIPARINALKPTKDSFSWVDALINSEKSAVDEYRQAIKETDNEHFVEVYSHILAEELEHIKELEELKK